jgi:tripartite-type tricarboxylate transporter receptor subunit TctC
MISANHVYRVAKPDGLTIGHFIGGLFLQQLLGKPGIEFDARKFEFIGVPAQDDFILGVSKASSITSVEQWMATKTVVKFGGIASGSGTDDVPNILKATLGLPIHLVSGYKGTADVRLAFNSGEIHGVSNSWQSTRSTWRKELDSGQLRVVLQVAQSSHPELKKIPLAADLAKNDEAKKLLQVVVQVHGASVRPYALPPGTPKDRVQLLNKAFMDTVKDPEFLAEAEKAKLEINPLSGEELAKSVLGVFQIEPGLVAKLKDILK